jgi:anti-sigma B factor antagonist
MTIHERQILNVTVLQLSGRITLTDGTDLLQESLQRLVDEGRTQVVLDFQQVPYVDSTAMAVIIRMHLRLSRQKQGRLKLVGVIGHVRELLTVTQLSSVFEIFDLEADAVASFAQGATAPE